METFSKDNRLISKSDFQNLKSGSRFLVSGAVISYQKKREEPNAPSRLGIAASKKFGNAVQRNHFKRITRESFRKSNFRDKGIDILVAPNLKYIKSNKIPHSELDKILSESLKQLFSTNNL